MPVLDRSTHFDVPPLTVIPTAAIEQKQMQATAANCEAVVATTAPTVFVIDDDPAVRESICDLLEAHDYIVKCFADGSAFLKSYRPGKRDCLLVDALMPTMGGIELVQHLKRNSIDLPAIVMSGKSALRMAVHAMKAGAIDFIEKPFNCSLLLDTIKASIQQADENVTLMDARRAAVARIASLTVRQREILDLVLAGHPSKNIAADLQISQRTVDNHRAAIARKTRTRSLAALIQTALWAKHSVLERQTPTTAARYSSARIETNYGSSVSFHASARTAHND